jgi:hypothetical protein
MQPRFASLNKMADEDHYYPWAFQLLVPVTALVAGFWRRYKLQRILGRAVDQF